MRFGSTHESRYPAGALFETYRDHLAHFGPRLDGVQEVQPVHLEEHGPVQVLVHRWSGDPKALPGPLRMLVPSRLFVWQDRTRWDAEQRVGQWCVTVPGLGSMVKMEGQHCFHPLPDGTGCKVEVEGRLHVALIGTLGGETANCFIRDLLTSILASSHEVIDTYMAERSSAAGASNSPSVTSRPGGGAG